MTPLVLYKYRSLSNWRFFADILVKRRLYAAPFRTLNDPMEGLLYLFDDSVTKRYRDSMRSASARLNICSLCESRVKSLLWSYYAEGHTGVAIGVTILDSKKPRVDKPEKVRYDMSVTIDQKTERSRSPSAVAKRVLSQKLTFWRHEDEHRVFTTQRHVPVEIREIVLGCKMTETDVRAVRELASKLVPSAPVTQLRRSELKWSGTCRSDTAKQRLERTGPQRCGWLPSRRPRSGGFFAGLPFTPWSSRRALVRARASAR